MTQFYICRHGETENNRARRLSGWIDTPLTEEGQQHALAVAGKLQGTDFDVIISSDLGRAFTTAYVIARQLGYDAEIVRLAGLREVNYGQLANKPYHEYPEVTPAENTDFVPPEGESLAAMQQRVLACLGTLERQYEGKTVLIVAHDGTINALRASFSGESMGEADATHNPHDFVAKFEVKESRTTSFVPL